MIPTLRSLTKLQKEAVLNAVVLTACASVLLGYVMHIIVQGPPTTWQAVIEVMPVDMKRDIAIEFCKDNRRFCRMLPMSSPIKVSPAGLPG